METGAKCTLTMSLDICVHETPFECQISSLVGAYGRTRPGDLV